MNEYNKGFRDASVLTFQCLADVLFGDIREKAQIKAQPEAIQESIRKIQFKMEDYLKEHADG